jgi:nitric-oxide synthase
VTIDGGQRGLPGPPKPGVDLDEAAEFFQLHAAEVRHAPHPSARLTQARREVDDRGVYTHTADEVEFGARVAWRNANRCIGRLYWRSLVVRDKRDVRDADDVAAECVAHLRAASNHGRIRPVITVFAADEPGLAAPRIRNDQLVRYGGYRSDDGVLGDPRHVDLTAWVEELGWVGKRTAFDVLPLVVDTPDAGVSLHEIPADAVLEVMIHHPQLPWFAELELRWYAVPAIANMPLRIGGITYPTTPFNGWYMGTEIGSRNLADPDRFDMLPTIGRKLGLPVNDDRSLWKDRALVELNRAVLWSFDDAGVKVADHHSESRHFMSFVAAEERGGRTPHAEWSWVVPPLSGSATPVYHRYYDESVAVPGFLRPDPWAPPTASPGDDRPDLWELYDRNDIPAIPPNSAIPAIPPNSAIPAIPPNSAVPAIPPNSGTGG